MLGCPTSLIYGNMQTDGVINITNPCNVNCGCPVSRLQPICSKDGTTNFYSPCQAGCKVKTMIYPKELGAKPYAVYEDCGCVLEAWQTLNTSLSEKWIKQDYMPNWEYTNKEIVSKVGEKYADNPIMEAEGGWCPVENCDAVFKTFMLCMFILMVLGSTGRIGNVLVALRCIDVEDKSLSMAFNVVFMSLFAMLPGPMVYGAIIDSTCILWQEECGDTTNCLLYDTVSLRKALMLTTAFIMLGGVLFDIGVWYHSKTLMIFNPEQKKIKESGEPEESETMLRKEDHFASNLSISKDAMFKNGVTLQT